MDSAIEFVRAAPGVHAPMQADKSALGLLPVSAFQYCEAVRVASGLGWYLFPPKDISLLFDGRETFIADEGQWRTFTNESLGPEFETYWNENTPSWLASHAPPYIRRFSNPGIVQIWTGYFASTREKTALHIRPIVNANDVSSFYCFEAIVEADVFHPMPLFVNIKIQKTGVEVLIQKDIPLFQVIALPKAMLQDQDARVLSISDIDQGACLFDWEGMNQTLRIKGVTPDRPIIGSYAAKVRKASKSVASDGSGAEQG